MEKKGLRLSAQDEEDLRVLSAYLQDASLRVGDLAYLPRARRFALLTERYCWECAEESEETGLRIRSALHFENVLHVTAQKIERGDPNVRLQLLGIGFAPGEEGSGTIDLYMDGGGCIRLSVECIDAKLHDMAEPWPERAPPSHDLDQDGSDR